VGAGELAGLDRARGATLGALLLGQAAGRTGDDEITVYKAMGHAMEDLVAATLAWESAVKKGAGAGIDW
jgi:ornithine cyclodeaminase/thiomorpholine-carboxylate dehydrogenase